MSSSTGSTSETPGPACRFGLAVEVQACADRLHGLLQTLDPRDVPLSWAPGLMGAFASAERAAMAGRMLMTSRAAEAGQWEREGCSSPADWLARQTGTTTGRARAELETSGRLSELDASSDAMRAGELSFEQAEAVTDAAAVNPGAEADLLEMARRESLRRTRAEAERRKAEAESEAAKRERDERVRRGRKVRISYRNGAGHLDAVGPVAAIKELEQALNSRIDRHLRENRDVKDREPIPAYRFDEVIEGCTRGLGGARRVSTRRVVMIRVDLTTLLRGEQHDGELCDIGGVTVSVAELRRLLGDSVLQLVLTNGEAVVDLVNLNRKPTVAQQLARLFTDPHCSAEGCDRGVCLEFDHRDDWARVLTTEVSNLDPLCGHHHDLKTRSNWKLVAGTGRRPMVPPTDPRHPDRPQEVPGESARMTDVRARLAGLHANEARHRAKRAALAAQGGLFDSS